MFYGYSILDLSTVDVTDTDPYTVNGIYNRVKYAFDNNIPIICSGLKIGGAKVGVFYLNGVAESSGDFVANELGYAITITDSDTITFTS